jgi:hypothetical protein
VRKIIANTPTRRRAAIVAAGIAAAAAIAVPGIAWASGSFSQTAPTSVGTPAAEPVPATQSDTPTIGEASIAPELSQEEIDALVAKGELTVTEATATTPAETRGEG